MSKHERNIVATLQRGRRKEIIWTRTYARLDTAQPRALAMAISRDVQPGDVIEVAHARSGMQLGTVKVGLGKVTATWVWEDEG